ncbi:uncharacterized protein LOC108240646 isoform X2 [Kryptolebias marmoratus]|uniref:uncharacterized protein LOC108240646 isoform X2 n=1 Tax=Kryptolebias marmoratus TaxID=37003 RepID=UPI0018ACCF71|nr:uncharacterized protein LOC108240646 isoform X2 [Kryptolebias marmoratus]
MSLCCLAEVSLFLANTATKSRLCLRSLFKFVCSAKFFQMILLKEHLRSKEHLEKMKTIYPQAATAKCEIIPNLVFVDPSKTINQPVVGLSLVTLCFGAELSLYLCHVCEKCIPLNSILNHIFSEEHRINYFNYTNPNDLFFSWTPSMNIKRILQPKLKQEMDKMESQALQILNLPRKLLEMLKTKAYSEVMQTLSENSKLTELLKDLQPKRMTIQAYQNDSNRRHPLLGMQHIVECVRVGPRENRHYLCSLCCITVANHMIINHVLSFDHIHCFFKAWHPSTLLSKQSYRTYSSFSPMIFDVAKQSEKIHGTASIKQVSLQPNEFQSVDFTCYSAALKKLESITKSKLTACVTPGNKLECNAAISVSRKPECKLRCQDCNEIFDAISSYLRHLSDFKHQKMLAKIFGPDAPQNYQAVRPFLSLYKHACESLRANQPIVGADLVVMCISSSVKVEPFYLCFCCLECIPQPCIGEHFESHKHLISTLMYQNPWRLPFAWEGDLKKNELKKMAWKEKEDKGEQSRIILKILDIPYSIFHDLMSSNYKQVMKNLQLYHALLKCQVPPCKTFSKQGNERFPLLGKQFLVSHDLIDMRNKPVVGLLCLLCERRLSIVESQAHVFSREHVTTFLNRFHPDSLNPSTDNTETLLDLAKQAADIHTVSHMQVIQLKRSIWEPCTYHRAITILSAAKNREGKGGLVPPIKPGTKLVPRKTQREEVQGHEKDGQKTCLDTDKTQNDAQIKEQKCDEETPDVKKNVQIEKAKVSEETPAPNKAELVVKKEVSVKVCPPEVKNAGETVHPTRVKTEEASTEINIEDATGSCKKMEKNGEAQARTKESPNIKHVTRQMSHQKNENKPPTPEQSQTQGCPDEDAGQQTGPKRPRSASKDDSSPQQPAKIPKIEVKKGIHNVGDAEKMAEKVQSDDFCNISATFFECRCVKRDPVYLCGGCSQKVPGKDIVGHLTEFKHQKMHRLVVHLDEQTYRNIFNQSFLSAIQILTSSPQSVCAPGHTSEILRSRDVDDKQVVDMEMSDAEQRVPTPDSFAATEASYKTSQVKAQKSDNHHAPLMINVPKATRDLSPKCWENDRKANLSSDTTDKSIQYETVPETELVAAAPVCSVPTLKLKSTTASTKRTETTSSSGPTISNTRLAASSATPFPLKSRSASASEVKSVSGKAAQVVCRTSSKVDSRPRCAEATPKPSIAPQTKATPAATAKTPGKHGNPDALAKTAHRTKSVGDNADTEAHKKIHPSVPHPPATVPASSEHQDPHKEPYLSASKAPSQNPPKVGTNQLIVVSCDKKKQVYCLLCSDKLNLSSQYHLTNFDHQLNYVKMKYPEWTAKESELKSKLSHTVALLAKVEKDLPHTRSAQKLEVGKELYKELRLLSDKEAVQRVKEMVRQKGSQVSSCPVADSSGASRLEVSSLCEVSSSVDGMLVSYDDQLEQEDRIQDQISEMESNVTFHQHSEDEDMEVDDEIQDQSDPEPVQIHDFYSEDVADAAQLEPDAEDQCHVEVTPPTERFGSTVPDTEIQRFPSKKQPDMGNKTLHQALQVQITEMEAYLSGEENSPSASKTHPDLILSRQADKTTGAKVVKTPSGTEHSLTAETQRRKSESTSQGPQKAYECPGKPSPVQICSPELQTDASAGQQSSSGLSCRAQAPDHGTGPKEQSSSQAQPSTLFGGKVQGCSNLPFYLKAHCPEPKLVIGMASVWECQRTPPKTFYLCESCEEKISCRDICHHMVSFDHQLKFLRRKHPEFLQMFWQEEDLTPAFKRELLNFIVRQLSAREQFYKVDAQCLLLAPELHEFVQTASFGEALKIVKTIMEDKSSVFCLPSQLNNQRSERESKTQSAHALGNNQKTESAEQSSLEENAGVEDLDVVGEVRVRSLEVDPSSSQDEPVASSAPIVGTHLAPQEACRGSSPRQTFKPHVPLLQNSGSMLQEKSVSNSAASTNDTSAVHERSNKLPPIRKRAAETPPETLLQSCTSGPLEHPLPAKRTASEPNPPSASFIPAENPTPLALNDKDSEPTLIKPTVNRQLFTELISALKEKNFKINQPPFMSAPDTAEAASSSEMKSMKDLKPLNTEFENATDRTALGSESRLVKAAVKKNPTSNCAAANNTEAPLDGVVLTSTAAAEEPKAPQTLQSSGAQDFFKNVSSFPANCSPSNQIQDWMPQRNSEPNRSSQQSISTIITTRPNPAKHTLQGSSNRQTHGDASRDDGDRFPTDPTAVAVPGGSYASRSQAAYFSGGDFFPQAAAGCATQNNPVVVAESSSQEYIYSSQMYPVRAGNPFTPHSFGHSLAAQRPPGWESLGLQQLQYYYLLTRGSGHNQ